MAAKNHRRAHANLADQKDCLRAGVGWRRWRIRVKAEWRHDDGIYGLLREGWWSRGIRFVWIRLPWVAKGGNLSRGRRKLVFHTRAREIAGTRGGVAVKRFNLAPRKIHHAALRHDEALSRELWFNAQGATRRENAHFTVLAESECRVASRACNRNRSRNDRGRIDREYLW